MIPIVHRGYLSYKHILARTSRLLQGVEELEEEVNQPRAKPRWKGETTWCAAYSFSLC